MPDPRDIVDISGLPRRGSPNAGGGGHSARPGGARPWLSIWFSCCSVYARIYRHPSGARYEGRCPRCGVRVQARIGPDGTSRRVFETV